MWQEGLQLQCKFGGHMVNPWVTRSNTLFAECARTPAYSYIRNFCELIRTILMRYHNNQLALVSLEDIWTSPRT
jgi:hypothetical protein